jgi:16S rRNA (cytosine1402-N4)-methyltransferase
MMTYHIPVMLAETIEGLNIKPEGVYVDLTYGSGGHSAEILKRLTTGSLYAFDQDEDAAANLMKDKKLHFIGGNFRFFRNYLREKGIEKVDGILADLGVSSHHFDCADRGFSYRFDSELDMRMNRNDDFSAKILVNTYSEKQLEKIFFEYGEIPFSRKLASAIIRARKEKPIRTTGELIRCIDFLLPRNLEHKFLSKIFQAIRIEVNQEVDVLKEMLLQCPIILKAGGVLAVISYHSLEDRLVKNFFKSGNLDGQLMKDFYGNIISPFEIARNKALAPKELETAENTRSRSAKLRIGIKN